MEKEFVPYEESYQLKTLGFAEPCFAYYGEINGGEIELFLKRNFDTEAKYLLAPTFSQAFRWFRKKYKLWGNIGMQASDYYTLMVYETLPDCCWILYNNKGYETDEEAELACLRKLIEIVKNK